MSILRFLTAGESHGPKLTGILEGLPAGFTIDIPAINQDLARRQQGFGRGGRMKIEHDCVQISAGVVDNKSTGAPIAIDISNLDYANWSDKTIEPFSTPRPGHADFAGAIKYHHDDIRLSLERSSARETAMRTAIGSLCKQILAGFDIQVIAYVTRIGEIASNTDQLLDQAGGLSHTAISGHADSLGAAYLKLYQTSLTNEFAFADASKSEELKEHIFAIMKAKDTLGGVFETVALGLPIGLGSYVHYDRKLDGIIAQAMMSIPAMKAVELGSAIKNASLRGTEVHDEFIIGPKDPRVSRTSNRAGGLEGGMTNGMPLVVRTYMKPISTTLAPRNSIDLASFKPSPTVYERSDFCAVQRACVVGEAMLSFVLLNALIDKIGGDDRDSMLRSYQNLFIGRLGELSMKKNPWRFNYGFSK